MELQLTPQQQQVLDSIHGPMKIIDPRTSTAYVLVRESDYEASREIVEDEQRRHAIHAVALRNAMGRMDEEP